MYRHLVNEIYRCRVHFAAHWLCT